MEGKGIIKFFLVLIVLVTAWQYFQYLPTARVERNAETHAEKMAATVAEDLRDDFRAQERRKYLDSMSTETVFSIPMVKDFNYDELKKGQLGLGLDLKGGMSVVMQVDLKNYLEQLSNNHQDEDFRAALETAEDNLRNAQDDYISLFIAAYNDREGADPLASIFARNPTLAEDINLNSSNAEVASVLREKANGTVNLLFNRLKERVDKLGTTQPNITLDAGRDLILIELPGIENPKRARDFLQASANLEFWKTYRATDANIVNTLAEFNETLRQEEKLKNGESLEPEYEITEIDSVTGKALDSVEIIDPDQEAGPLFQVFSPNVTQEGRIATSPIIGFAAKNKKEAVNDILARQDLRAKLPADLDFRWSRKGIQDAENNQTNTFALYAIKKDRGNNPHLDGGVVTNAQATPDPTRGDIVVSLKMNNRGAQAWADLTTEAYNDNERELAIVLDNEVVSAPSVNGPITGGSSQIYGGFTLQEADDLANILEVGKLPAKTKIIQDNVVGPSLGADNIKSSINSLGIGLLLVLLFMVFYYGTGGIVSIIALVINLVFIMAALAGINTVLTLPGVAGIVLTIGMAVDANVIIFERIREELRLGKTVLSAVRDGFKNSYSAIIDANVTSLLTAIVLMVFGLGPIKGFAIVLIVGILSSFFTAVLIGRLMIEWWITSGKNMSFWTPPTKNAFANINFDWLSKRKIAYAFSGIVIAAGIVSMFTRKFELGVDFKGGYSYNISFPQNQDIDLATLRSGVQGALEGASTTVKAVSTQNTFNVVTSYLIDDDSDDAGERVMEQIHAGVQAALGTDINYDNFKNIEGDGVHITSSAKVGPTIADDIKKSSTWATLFSLLLIFFYILIRFNKWQYGVGAVAALFHDTLFVLGIFSLGHGLLPFSLEIDQAFIGALLTVIGYSINDTVVVFDRIREYLNIYTNKAKDEVINMAVSSTISRTVITSLTTLFVVLVLFLFGGTSIKGMAFALVIGVIVGTYSSIFVATPIMAGLTKELKANDVKQSRRFSKHVG